MQNKMFGEHPYGRDPYGSEEELRNLNIKDAQSFISNIVSKKEVVYSFVGDLSEKEVVDRIEGFSKKMPEGPRRATAVDIPPLKNNHHVFNESPKEQTHIILAYRGISVADESRYVIEVLQSILSGQGGRLFIELRDKASLAYTVAPVRMDGIEAGYFGSYIACSTDKADRSVQMMRAEFDKLVQKKVGDLELERAKKYLIGRHDIALQRTGHVADLMLFNELYGIGFREHENFKDHVRAITANDIIKIAERIFSEKWVLSVVGKKNVTQ